MRVALTHPYCWPYVRRGSERNMHDHARYLAGRGHQVVTVSTRPQGPGEEWTEGGRRILHRPVGGPVLARLRIDPRHTFPFSCARTLRSLRVDVVHSFFVSDSLAAAWTRRRGGHKTVLQMNGVAVGGVSCRRWFPPEGWMFREAIRRADHRIACSRYVRGLVLEHYGTDCDVIPPLLAVDALPPGDGPPDGCPTFLAVGDFTVRSKGVRALVRAFRVVKRRLPDALMRLSGRMTPELRRELLGDLPEAERSGVEVMGLGRVEDLPRVYGEASVLVHAAKWEPSGSVVLEALAAGTPVVVADHGGTPEYTGEGVSVLFDPGGGVEADNVEGIAQAMLAGLELAQSPGVRARCREHARRFFPEVLGPRYESIYAA